MTDATKPALKDGQTGPEADIAKRRRPAAAAQQGQGVAATAAQGQASAEADRPAQVEAAASAGAAVNETAGDIGNFFKDLWEKMKHNGPRHWIGMLLGGLGAWMIGSAFGGGGIISTVISGLLTVGGMIIGRKFADEHFGDAAQTNAPTAAGQSRAAAPGHAAAPAVAMTQVPLQPLDKVLANARAVAQGAKGAEPEFIKKNGEWVLSDEAQKIYDAGMAQRNNAKTALPAPQYDPGNGSAPVSPGALPYASAARTR